MPVRKADISRYEERLSVERLKKFHRVYAHIFARGSLSDAAKTCHVHTNTVSTWIQEIERDLFGGNPETRPQLVDRKRHPAGRTDEGDKLFQYTSTFVPHLLKEVIFARDKTTLHITGTGAGIGLILSRVLAETTFLKDNPGIDIMAHGGSYEEVIAAIQTTGSEIGLVLAKEVISAAGIDSQKLGQSRRVLLHRKDREPPTLDTISQETMIFLNSDIIQSEDERLLFPATERTIGLPSSAAIVCALLSGLDAIAVGFDNYAEKLLDVLDFTELERLDDTEPVWPIVYFPDSKVRSLSDAGASLKQHLEERFGTTDPS